LCVRLKNWPIDRQRRRLHKEQSLKRAASTETSSAEFVVSTQRRIRGRPTNDPPRQRRWNHQMWQDGPRDLKVTSAGRPKLFMPDRGICMTPGVRASGPSYIKPVPPPVTRPTQTPKTNEPPMAIVR